MVIAVPLATYVWRHLIMGEEEHVTEPLEPSPSPVAG